MDAGSINSRIRSLEGKVTRLETAKSNAKDLSFDINVYRVQVNSHKNSVISSKSSWEGQTIVNFDALYRSAVDYLRSDVTSKYATLIDAIEEKIDDINREISSLRSHLNSR